MEEVRQLVQEEGREARNLVAFHVSVESSAPRVSRKPPRLLPSARRAPPRPARLRSASAGRDKRSELRARYWALLFGDLQRAIGEIYNTVEVHENLSECQEVILVLENYTRDFKALCEWFRLKWEYDNTPPPQRPQSLAWEIRKTDFVRPESRKAHSVRSSPSVSGKNSPCLSGHNTPSGKNSPNLLTGKTSPGSGKISPRISSHSITSPKSNIEFFSNKIASKVMAKPEPKSAKDLARLSDIKEKIVDDVSVKDVTKDEFKPDHEVTTDDNLLTDQTSKTKKTVESLSVQAKATINQLNVMECAFLEKQLIENAIKNDNILNQDREREVKEQLDKYPINDLETESPTKSEENFADVSSGSSKSVDDLKEIDVNDQPDAVKVSKKDDSENIKKIDIQDSQKKDDTDITSSIEQEHAKKEKSEVKVEVKPTRPAYSQAAAKPKLVTTTTKVESKPVSKTASLPLTRSKTVVEIRSMGPKPQRPFPKRNQTVKCSYPFNLTTGRTSLFETNKQASKRPLKPNQTGSGDNKTKIDPKKLPFKRPTTLKLNENGDKKEKTQLEKIKDCEEYSSSETVVTQIDMSRIESSESLKTLIAEDREFAQDVANSIEVLNIDGNKNDNEGWLTVKSRRLSREYKKQSKSHWSNRFHQPSATTSLPTLNMIESPKQETKPIISTPPHPKLDRAKSEQPQSERKVEKTVKVVVNTKPSKDRSKNTSMIRQKSDVTGLKSRSARNKALSKKSEKNRERKNSDLSDLTKNRLHSSLESLTGLSRSQESTEEPFDFDKWKAEFKSTFKYLDEDDQMTDHNDILKDADPSEMSEIAEMTSQIEENERKISLALDFQCEVDQRKLSEEEDLLNRQIMELQQVSDVDLDTETDDTETDLELASPPLPLPTAPVGCGGTTTLEDQYEAVLEGMSWAERVDTLQQLEQLVSRHPGRAQQLHAKLSQGIKRRGSFQDALRRLQAKQARAEQQRQDLQTERTKKIHMLLTRVEEVKVAKNQLIEDKRLRMERRLQKAAENRDQHLKDIVRKAHDEEEKLREIAFIKQLEAENRRHEFLEQCRSHTGRLRVLRRERLDKLKQKADREMAVGLRRQALEQARLMHVENLLERRKLRDQRVQERRGQRQLERDHAAREKAEGVRSRLSALAAAAAREARLLRRRIHDKQRASQLRLHSHLQAVRARAARHQTTSESNENENLPADEEEVIDQITQEKKERDRLKAMKKRARKLRQKLLIAGQEYEDIHYQDANPISSNNKVGKILNQINTIVITIQQNETKPQQNGIDKDGNKNKNMNDNLQKHLTNGEVTETKKSKKKKGSSVEKQLNNTDKIIENNVDNTESAKENIMDSTTVNIVPIKTKSKKKKNKEPSPENDNDKNRNDKQKNGNDKMKLVKSPSIASSMSDMSKVSCKSDKKLPANIDWTYFEKIMNELNRAIEKVDKSAQETLLHGMKILVQLLGLAVDREEYSLQVTSKCLSTLMTVLSRVMSIDASAALEFVNSNGCVHAVKLLSTQLDKDLEGDKTEQSLTTQACLCVGQALEVVLQSTRAYEDVRETGVDKKVPSLASHRQRAHCVVNYLCISGSLSHSDLCNAVKDNIHSLITVCANLCRPCDVDTGQDRTTAISSLRTSMAYELGGARSDFCSLFEEVEVEDASVARTTRLLRALAELDHTLVQEAFGEGHWLLEFRAAVARLLSLHAPTDREPPRNNSKQGEPAITQSEEIVVDIIVLIGLVVVNNAAHQEVLCEGWSAIKILCNLPARWLVWSHRGALLPALAALAQHPPAAAVIQAEMSPQMIEDYITSPEASNVRLVQILKEGQKKSHKK